MFEERNHLTDPAINLSCIYCSRDLYPFKSIDRFEIVLESLDDLKRTFLKIRCLFCKSIFHEKKFRHKNWISWYQEKIIAQFEKQQLEYWENRKKIS